MAEAANADTTLRGDSDGKRKHIGYFDRKEDAARAYADAAHKFFGEFARTE